MYIEIYKINLHIFCSKKTSFWGDDKKSKEDYNCFQCVYLMYVLVRTKLFYSILKHLGFVENGNLIKLDLLPF